jgi:hypothetical protein
VVLSVKRIHRKTGRRGEFGVGTPVGYDRAIDRQAHSTLRDDADEQPPNKASRLPGFL